MQHTPLLINLSQDWSLYNLNNEAADQGMLGANPATTGALLLPSTTGTPAAAEAQLNDLSKKEQLQMAIHADKSIPHFLGMLQFDQQIQQAVQQITLAQGDTAEEYDEKEQITLIFMICQMNL